MVIKHNKNMIFVKEKGVFYSRDKKLKRFKIREIKTYLDLMADYILHLK